MSEEKKDEKPSLSLRQSRFIIEALEAPSMIEAGRRTGVPKSTWARWAKDPVFSQALESVRQEAFDSGLKLFKQSIKKAGLTLVRLLESKNEDTRRLAAGDIVRAAFRVYELTDLEARIAALEGDAQGERARSGVGIADLQAALADSEKEGDDGALRQPR